MADNPLRYIRKRDSGKYQVTITHKGRRYHEGTFPTEQEAVAARDAAIERMKCTQLEAPGRIVHGVTAGECPDEDAIYQKALAAYRRSAELDIRRASQRVEFSDKAICLAWLGDLHLGDVGTDIERAFDDAEVIAGTPGMYATLNGDLVDNFIKQWALKLYLGGSGLNIAEQWALLRRYLRLLGPKTWLVLGGNHEAWTEQLAGVDVLRGLVAEFSPAALYDAHDCRVVVSVAGTEYPIRVRHQWRGKSIYNATQGIERAARFDERDFVIGVGAHTHEAALARQFVVDGQTLLAVLTGTYKRLDQYAREQGFPASNQATAIATVICAESCEPMAFSDLGMAARVLGALRA